MIRTKICGWFVILTILNPIQLVWGQASFSETYLKNDLPLAEVSALESKKDSIKACAWRLLEMLRDHSPFLRQNRFKPIEIIGVTSVLNQITFTATLNPSLSIQGTMFISHRESSSASEGALVSCNLRDTWLGEPDFSLSDGNNLIYTIEVNWF